MALPFHVVSVSRRCSYVSDDPGFLNEQRALYQTIRRAREALSVVLRVVALAVAPSIVNIVNEHEGS